jgi:hypothetical protein
MWTQHNPLEGVEDKSDNEGRRLLGYKSPGRTSQETHYFSAAETSRLMLCKIWNFHGGCYEEYRLLGYKNQGRTSHKTVLLRCRDQPINAMQDLRFPRRLLWTKSSFWMLRRVALVRTDFSDERSASIVRVTRVGELGRTLAVTNNRRKLRRNTIILKYDDVRPSFISLWVWFNNSAYENVGEFSEKKSKGRLQTQSRNFMANGCTTGVLNEEG